MMLFPRMTLSGVTNVKSVVLCARAHTHTCQCVNGCQVSLLNGGYMWQFIVAQRIDTEHFSG